MLEGNKVILRSLEPADAEFTYALRKDTDAIKQLLGYPYPVNRVNEDEWIARLYGKAAAGGVFLAIIDKADGTFCGYISVQHINQLHRTASFGIIVTKEKRGKGLAADAMRVFFAYLHQQLNLRKITLQVLEENANAIAAYTKAGFVQEGILRQEVWQDGRYKNICIMSLFLQ